MRSLGITLALLMALPSLPRMQDAALPRVETAVPRGDTATSARVRTIVIDPGHGGDDIGARGAGGFEEKRLALEVALRLRTMLETQLSLRVVLTREDDRAVPPDERAGIANAAHGVLLLSLHANAAPATSISGAEVYYSARDQTPGERSPAADGPLTLVPWEEAQARQFDYSAQAAGLVHEELGRLVPMSPKSIRQAPLRVLRGASMPAVLVEMLFLTNPEQEQAASTAELKDMLATALTTAVSRFEALMGLAVAAVTRRLWLQAGAAVVLLVVLSWGATRLLERLIAPPAGPVLPDTEPAAADTGHIQATLFFGSSDGLALVPVRRDVALGGDPGAQGRQILLALLQPAPAPYLSLIPMGTTLRAFYIGNTGDAFVDLSREASSAHPGGSFSELLTVQAIVHTVTSNLAPARRVQILIDGKEVDTLAGHIDLRRPLTPDPSVIRGN